MAASIAEMMSIRPLSDLSFESLHKVAKMGNTADIGYGGCAMAMAINAAFATIPSPSYILYSSLGYYLGPTLTTTTVTLDVTIIRDTRSFATRKVEVKQTQKGVLRTTFYVLCDFQVSDPSVLTYSLKPYPSSAQPETLLNYPDLLQQRVAKGEISQELLNTWKLFFPLMTLYFEVRHTPESLSGQNMNGVDKKKITDQEHLPITEKYAAWWFRSKVSLTGDAANHAAFSFMLDAALSFLPALFNHQFLDDYAAISSSDLSMRFHSPDINANEWNLLEQQTEVGNMGKTWSTARIFNRDGVQIANMSQSSILRGYKNQKAVKL